MDSSPVKDLKRQEDDLPILRPQSFKEFVGQREVCQNLEVFIEAAKKRKEALDHVLLHGPPGLGKTTLAQIIAKTMGVNIRFTAGPVISKSGDLASLLTNLQPFDVLFIDEIHRLNTAVEEVLYAAMEDFKLDIMIGEGPAARAVRIDLPPFTLIGATTRSGLLTQPLRERFGIPLRLEYYEVSDLKKIVMRGCSVLHTEIDDQAAQEVAKRSRGTPRVAGRLLRRCRDFATVEHESSITLGIAENALNQLGVDPLGLDAMDQRYLTSIAEFYQGGPVGIDTIAAVLSEKSDTIEDVIEPYLLQKGFIQRTKSGRVLTPLAYEHLELKRVE